MAAVMIFPIVIMLIFAVLQGAFYYHARNAVQHAATAAVHAARVETGTVADGHAAASTRLDAADSVLHNPKVTVSRSTTTVTVTITAKVDSMVPGVSGWTVKQTAAGAVERFTTGSGS